VNGDCLKLTTYFGERDRTPRGLLADELLDLYNERGLEASVLLRGSEGFGLHAHRRTDRLLSLSEDLPLVSVAIDTRDRIESTLEHVLAIKHRGLVTLERVRLLAGELEPEQLGEATKLTVYVGRRERAAGGAPAFVAVCDLLHRRGIAGATVLLGVDGTRRGQRARARFFSANADVPTMIVAVAASERVAAVLGELRGLLSDPLLTLERVRVCKRDGELLATPHELPGTDARGRPLWQKLEIHCSQAAIRNGEALNLAIIRRLRRSHAAGATSVRGIWGFHGERPPHGDRFFQIRRHVPVVTVVIDTPERIASSFQIVDELTGDHGLVTSEMVPALTAIGASERQDGLPLADHEF
jgi:PII-like signaling protein